MSPAAPASTWALKFVSGKYQGGLYPLRFDREVVIGRASDLDLVLAEDMVSRKHAKIFFRDGAFWIQDLGSTNGTFVNGEKVKKARLTEGDRLLIGGSILKVVKDERAGEQTDEEVRRSLEEAAAASPRPSAMQGRLEEVPLPDLLQLLATGKKTGVLALRTSEHEAHVHFRAGQVIRCVVDGNSALSPKKSFFRVLRWSAGSFEFHPASGPVEEPAGPEISDALELLLMEGMRQQDELKRLEDLPPLDAQLAPALPLAAPLRALSPEELDLFELALDRATVQAMLDRSPALDCEAAQALVSLVKRGYLRRAPV